MTTTARSAQVADSLLPYSDPRHLQMWQLLVEEAHLFDTQQYERWLEMLSEDIRYLMPVQVTAAKNAGYDELAGMSHFDEDLYSLTKRVERFGTQHAWAEDPPSRLRHYVTNVRTFQTAAPDELYVESYELVFRSRGDVRTAEIVSAAREDRFRRQEERWRLVQRVIHVDESVLRTQNLAIFL